MRLGEYPRIVGATDFGAAIIAKPTPVLKAAIPAKAGAPE